MRKIKKKIRLGEKMNVFLSKFGEGYLPLTALTIKCQPKMYLKNEKFFIFLGDFLKKVLFSDL